MQQRYGMGRHYGMLRHYQMPSIHRQKTLGNILKSRYQDALGVAVLRLVLVQQVDPANAITL